jgi:putative ABC transport system permease protein
VIRLIFATPALGPVYVAVMLGAAAYTSSRRIATPGAMTAALVSIAAGTATVAVVVFVSQALPFDARNAVPFTAQVVGGAMTATTLAGLRFRDEVVRQWDVVEGWLALGAQPAEAVRELGRFSAARALVPALDQTRNVGLVVLPGAFVGLLLGGATPLQAGRLQLLVLIGLLAAETVAALLVTWLIGAALVVHRPPELARTTG